MRGKYLFGANHVQSIRQAFVVSLCGGQARQDTMTEAKDVVTWLGKGTSPC